MTLSWTPVANGLIYCAPACGHGCTQIQYGTAIHQAMALAMKLGPGWEPNVWENLGWHYKAISPCGLIKVHKPQDGLYTAFFGTPDSGGRWFADNRTPKGAVAAVIAVAQAEADGIKALLNRAHDTHKKARRED